MPFPAHRTEPSYASRTECRSLTVRPRLSHLSHARSQQQYLIKGALYLLLVPAHRATDEEADEVLLRWLDALQAKAPGAVVQVVLSHVDRLEPLQAQLATHTRREDEVYCAFGSTSVASPVLPCALLSALLLSPPSLLFPLLLCPSSPLPLLSPLASSLPSPPLPSDSPPDTCVNSTATSYSRARWRICSTPRRTPSPSPLRLSSLGSRRSCKHTPSALRPLRRREEGPSGLIRCACSRTSPACARPRAGTLLF